MTMDYIPPDDRRWTTCNVCGEEFRSRNDLVTHVRATHSFRHLSPSQRPRQRGDVACGHCDMSFTTKSGATMHRRAVHGISYGDQIP